MPLLQGRQHTWYCGAYTLFNTHEIATMSGALCSCAGWLPLQIRGLAAVAQLQIPTRLPVPVPASNKPLCAALTCCRPGCGGAAGRALSLWSRQAGSPAGAIATEAAVQSAGSRGCRSWAPVRAPGLSLLPDSLLHPITYPRSLTRTSAWRTAPLPAALGSHPQRQLPWPTALERLGPSTNE